MTVYGLDVSDNQGAFDWAPWRHKIAFAAVKATEGTGFFDPQFPRNWRQMLDLNGRGKLARIAYHFFHASEDPITQADNLVNYVRHAGLLAGDQFALDLEILDGQSPATVAQAAKAFCERVNTFSGGHRCLVYTNPATAETGACATLGPWHLWEAEYGVTRPEVPHPWTGWRLWQYSDAGIDRDMWNGSKRQMQDFLRMPKDRR